MRIRGRWKVQRERFWWKRVSGLGRRYGWMVRGRRLASLTVFEGSGHWQFVVGPVSIASVLR